MPRVRYVNQRGDLPANPLHSFCTAISVGIVDGTPVLTEDTAGHTNGKPPPPPGPTYSVIDPRQTKLRTV